MTVQPPHVGDELQDLLDGKLPDARRAEVAAHVASCARCARELASLEFAKQHAPTLYAAAPLPDGLAARVRASLDAEDRRVQPARWTRRAWIGGALAAAAAIVVFVRTRHRATIPELVAADFLAYDSGTALLAVESADPKVVEAFFAANGAAFRTRVLDLGMMQYRLVGGRVHQLDGRTCAEFAYRGPGNVALVCQMYEGRVADLPAAAEQREHGGIDFYVHHFQGVTAVFWAEGGVVCVLAATLPSEDVVQLAFAKAMKATASAD